MSEPEKCLAVEKRVKHKRAFRESLRGDFYLMERYGYTCMWYRKVLKKGKTKMAPYIKLCQVPSPDNFLQSVYFFPGRVFYTLEIVSF